MTKSGQHTEEILGCSWELFQQHIQDKIDLWNNYAFDDERELSWDNIDIDHIHPLASAKDEDEVKALCHFTNLQPLWKDVNKTKSDRWSDLDQTFWQANIFKNPNYKDIYVPKGLKI